MFKFVFYDLLNDKIYKRQILRQSVSFMTITIVFVRDDLGEVAVEGREFVIRPPHSIDLTLSVYHLFY